jgi:hypothetical protein
MNQECHQHCRQKVTISFSLRQTTLEHHEFPSKTAPVSGNSFLQRLNSMQVRQRTQLSGKTRIIANSHCRFSASPYVSRGACKFPAATDSNCSLRWRIAALAAARRGWLICQQEFRTGHSAIQNIVTKHHRLFH